MWKTILLVSVLAACSLSALGADVKSPARKVGPGLVEVTVVGMGESKPEALRDAQRKAIEQGAGTFIYSHSKVQDFELIHDTILARSAGFVQSYKILSERKTPDGIIELKISAVVSVKGIEDVWGVATNLLKQMGRPKIMVFLTERIDRSSQEDSTVQTRIEHLLLTNGFQLVNRNQLKAIDQKDITAAIAEDNPGKIQAIAKRFGAQLFITGSTNASLGEAKTVYGVPVYRYGADGDVKCYRSDTAQLLVSQNANAEHADRTQRVAAKKSLHALGEVLGPKVQYDILKFWMDVLEGRGEVQLEVDNVTTFSQRTRIKNALEKLKQVKSVDNIDYHKPILKASIQSDVTAETLAEKIDEAMGESLEITDVTQNVIKAKYSGD